MQRRNWPTVQQLGREIGRNPNHLRRVALHVLAATGGAFRGRTRHGQVAWRVNPAALKRYFKELEAGNGRRSPAPRRKSSAARIAAKSGSTIPITITIHVPEELLKRLFGSASNKP